MKGREPFDSDDLLTLAVISNMVRAGFTPQQCRQLVDRLRAEIGGSVFTVRQVGAVKVTVNLSQIRASLDRALTKRRAA